MTTSELKWLEVIVKPMRDRDLELIALFRSLLFGSNLECRPIDLSILLTAAYLRATHRLKTADSIHATTAIQAGVSLFVTNDRGFLKVPGPNVVILDDVAASRSDNPTQTAEEPEEPPPNSLGDA